ncbi:hypothetical protein DFH07DRAFT_944449 [Mycena maculata]|uniref:F-box domain-containing protein n=1 Tax=Mycena maculata TaxID=230809 RepID=A0AAD7I7L1_9AGAR|nr:hypothetical protein DFH07DRAFT_944449 [Mycena maculata]
MTAGFPNELWSETFAYLPPPSLISLHSTSRSFHGLSRPLLFKHFDFHPFQISGPIQGQLRFAGQSGIDRNVRRLEFWTSNEIAPFVQGCSVSAIRRSADNPARVFAAFFKLLPNLYNLRGLSCCLVDFDQAAVISLSSFPNLVRLQIISCNLRGNLGVLPLLRVTTFVMNQMGHLESLKVAGVHRWIKILDTDRLDDLRIQPPPSSTVFLENASTSSFHHIHTLLVGITSWSQLPILSNFSAIRNLQITACPPWNSETQALLFPHLMTYDGPHEVLLLLHPRASPKRVAIRGCDPVLLLERFGTNHSIMRRVEQLVLWSDSLQAEVLLKILQSFPNLSEFRLNVVQLPGVLPDAGTHTPQSFFESLKTSSPFPSCVQKIYIAWQIGGPSHEPFSLSSVQLQKISDGIQRVHDDLKCIWLVVWGCQYLWIRGADDPYVRTKYYGGWNLEFEFSPPDTKDTFAVLYHNA